MTIHELRQRLSDAVEARRAVAAEIEGAPEDVTAEQLTEMQERFDASQSTVDQLTSQVAHRERVAEARAAAPVQPVADNTAPGTVTITDQPAVYRQHGGPSYFSDVYNAAQGDFQARERLEAHGREVADRLGPEQMRALNETAGTGGAYVPPLYLQSEWIALARAARPLADAMSHMPLPGGTNSIVIPKVATGTAVAAQQDNTTVQSTDPTDATITVPVITEAGQNDVARQLLERSSQAGSSIDTIIFQDLLGAYNTAVDVQVISGSGTGGNAKGLLSNTNRTITTYTDASPAFVGAGKLYGKIASAISSMHTTRFLPPDLIAMHPRRWNWMVAQMDANNRPIITPYAPFNAAGQFDRVASQALVGNLMGLPVLVDASIPINQGAGTNQDVIFVLRTADLWLLEDANMPVAKTFEQTLSGTLTIRLQLYGYLAFTSERYNASVATIEGTGLVTPVF